MVKSDFWNFFLFENMLCFSALSFSLHEQCLGRAIVVTLALHGSWWWQTANVNFPFKVLGPHYFLNPLMDFVHVWCDDRYWSQNFMKYHLSSPPPPPPPTHTHTHTQRHTCDLRVKVMDLEFLC